MIDFKALAAPFPPDQIQWRVGATNKDKTQGLALAYIDARTVQDRLDAVCGPAGWQNRFPHAGQKTICEIGIWMSDDVTNPDRLPVDWVWKSDGAGDSDVEAEKGAVSDAFKRAAVKWGVGRYLYDLDSPWVALEKRGNSYAIAKSEEARLAKLIVAVNARLTGITPSPPERSQSSAHGRALAAEEPQLIDHTRKKGEMPAAANTNPGFGRPPTIEEARAAKIKAGVDKRVNALNMRNDWTRAELDQFWKDNEEWISWMADANNKALREYQRFTDAFANAETNMRDVA